ncbi:MAG: ATP12 family protein, partial [Hyphococcus sp.]
EILNYLSTDLLCYRAQRPDALVKRQCKIWDPYLHWFKSEFGVGLVSTTGIQAVQQPAEAVKAVETVLADCSPERLFALARMTKLTGSAVLALAGWKSFEDSVTIFAASRVDEYFQEEKWGVDQEAKVRENDIRNEFFAVCRLLSFL